MKEKKLDKETVLASGQTEKDIEIDRQLAMTCHILGLITGFIGPLVYCLTKREDAEFLQHHEKEAFNFQITIAIAMTVAVYLDFNVFESLYLIPVVVIIDLILSFTAVMKAKEDIYYKYPISIPFLRTKK